MSCESQNDTPLFREMRVGQTARRPRNLCQENIVYLLNTSYSEAPVKVVQAEVSDCQIVDFDCKTAAPDLKLLTSA